jgi:DNA-binding MarR family transcriptional regulator
MHHAGEKIPAITESACAEKMYLRRQVLSTPMRPTRHRAGTDAITTAASAADHPLVLAFGHLQGAATRLEYLLGKELERQCGISHATFEVLLILARAGRDGLPMGAISQERVLSSGGATRLIDRMEADGLVMRIPDADDRRARRVRLTAKGERVAVDAARIHVANVQRRFLDPVATEHHDQLIADLRTLSHTARDALPRLP